MHNRTNGVTTRIAALDDTVMITNQLGIAMNNACITVDPAKGGAVGSERTRNQVPEQSAQ
ncbi:hypothetical protein ABER23_33105 [Paenibacillus lautus]|uniref:hypothetical protein n=1 Tax=Paenibacillus lautus TaxID=1401 RepID=UPI003D29369B